ncbi:GNAT family N-acetyltransferase [Patescibacteria group bacterium]|nr:GNAT family N-acetyltransferase [Patescibacteria group bacterium]MBU1868386.1 GNAT family N-acetyltransferase [Patescibacteria group bacterium]
MKKSFRLLQIRSATIKDIETIQAIEQAAFAAHVIREELEQIFNEERGNAFLAHQNNTAVGYLVILYENLDEEKLQPLLRKAKKRGEPIMHDDTHIKKGSQLYFHLLGVLPSQQNKGIGHKLLEHALATLPFDNKDLERTTCVRVNNLASIRLLSKVLRMSMVSRKSPPWEKINGHPMLGSVETNFNASSKIEPITTPSRVNTRKIWLPKYKQPKDNEFLVAITHGEEDELDPAVIEQINQVMAFTGEALEGKYVIRGVFKGIELDLNPNLSYFYFTKV